MPKHEFFEGIWTVKHVRNGKVIWEETKRNDLVDEGEQSMLDTYFRNQNSPSEFYVRLAYDSIAETDTLTSITGEPSGNGYAPKLIERNIIGWITLAKDDGDYQVTSKEVEFTASGGDIGPVNVMYLATTANNSGKLICAVALSTDRTILSGDSAYVTIKIKLK